MKRMRQTRLGARLAGILLAIIAMIVISTAVHAQPREDQYGSPTDRAGGVSQVLSVLPDTGGPMALVFGGALIIAGTGVALFRSRVGNR